MNKFIFFSNPVAAIAQDRATLNLNDLNIRYILLTGIPSTLSNASEGTSPMKTKNIKKCACFNCVLSNNNLEQKSAFFILH